MPKAKTPRWTKEEIREKLATDDRWLVKGLLTIYGYQTADERNSGQTVEDNGMGFNGVDAQFLTDMVLSYQHYNRLTPGQIECTRKMMLKYAGQLAGHANRTHPKKADPA